jgi:ABC-type oligopeptide transport system substrate-binding subunit
MKKLLTVAILLTALVLTACAHIKITSTTCYPNGTTNIETFAGSSFFDSTIQITKAKAGNTNGAILVGGFNEQSTSTNLSAELSTLANLAARMGY